MLYELLSRGILRLREVFLTLNRKLMIVFVVFSPSGKTCQQADPCASNPCANGGQCTPFESHYICNCMPAFSGQTCKQDMNECALSPAPCKNGGTCINEVGSYHCVCPAEYTGKHCETLYVPCNPSPCQNGGTCVQKGDTSYECTCLPGTTCPQPSPPDPQLCCPVTVVNEGLFSLSLL